jgi:hypothetical protein
MDDNTAPFFLQMTEHHLKHGLDIVQAFLDSGLVASKSAAHRLIAQGGAYVNGQAVADIDRVLGLGDVKNGCVLLRAGKKKYARISLAAVNHGQRSSDVHDGIASRANRYADLEKSGSTLAPSNNA